jgi:hypothetical protein
MTDVIVKRSEWNRGHRSFLVNDFGYRCCLGFAGLVCGLTDQEMELEPTPKSFCYAFLKTFPKLLTETENYGNSAICEELMGINDFIYLNEGGEVERERKLIDLGKKADINFIFVD